MDRARPVTFVSNVYVDPDTMPAELAVTAARRLVLTARFAPLTTWLYRRRS